MAFSAHERTILLAVKGVGPTVVRRLEELGIEDLASLAQQDAAALCVAASAQLGSTCWRNSPQARAAIAGAIEAAQRAQDAPAAT
ncbi:helix-hairpin-helix domain-containing protein [Phenylobacterium sp.]|uniref:helix-hairpin-helix domain-containing protein n=1 Tax=Phenylobacterium sp. TaxID=1871053 RepID=UPI002730B5FB|nr:helix-hairpin-helix domain-containing protein [Phenylobacterium sp.]MDP1600112.1 helix-hairpin-helix domain-containing protein [Phenylobacterium sp.]MDP3594010.1 helix-hairpin-helix domain-containing protein [Phenylobacterium sp.]